MKASTQAALDILNMNPADRAAAIAAMRARFAEQCARTEASPERPAHVSAAYWARMGRAEQVALVNLHRENVQYRATISGAQV